MKKLLAAVALCLVSTSGFAAAPNQPGPQPENGANLEATCNAFLTCPDGHRVSCTAYQTEPNTVQHCQRNPILDAYGNLSNASNVRCWDTDLRGSTIDDYTQGCISQ